METARMALAPSRDFFGLAEGGVHFIGVGGVQPRHCPGQGGGDVLGGPAGAFAGVAARLAVPQLMGLKGAGGSAAGGTAPAQGPARQPDLGLHGGVAPGVQDLPPGHLYNFEGIHTNVTSVVIPPRRGPKTASGRGRGYL